MTRRFFLLLATLTLGSTAASAGLLYRVTLNTTPFNGTSGFIDLAFNQANAATSGPATVTLSNFQAVGYGFSPGDDQLTTGVTGSYAAPPIVIPNDAAGANYYSIAVTYGTSFSFDVMLAGGALSGGYTDGSAFLVTLYDTGFGYLTTPLASNEVANIQIDGNGVITSQGSTFNSTGSADVTELPEPAAIWLTSAGLGLALLARRRLAIG